MLDLIISYINFLVIGIVYIVKRLTFNPPIPPLYKSEPTDNEDEDDILFLIDNKNKKPTYKIIEFRFIDYKFIKLKYSDKEELPLLLFIPPNHIQVCIIYSHGNSGDLGACILEYYDIAMNTNCLVVSFEYPGYGECLNQPLRESLFYRNIKMTYIFVRDILKYQPSQIILYGFSMGSGIVFDLACNKDFPCAGMVLHSAFLSIVRTLYNIKKTMYFDFFNSCDKAKFLKTKTFFLHGTKDNVVPFIHGRILAKLIPQQYFYGFYKVDNGNHNDLFKMEKEKIFAQIRNFIKDCTGYYSDINKDYFSDEKTSSNKYTNSENNNNSSRNNNTSNNENIIDDNNNYFNKLNNNKIPNQKIISSNMKESNPLVKHQIIKSDALNNNNYESDTQNLEFLGTFNGHKVNNFNDNLNNNNNSFSYNNANTSMNNFYN